MWNGVGERQVTTGSMNKDTSHSVYLSIVKAALDAPYVVADLETTSLNSRTGQILEIAALKADASGTATSSFARLIRTRTAIPAAITKLTGITQADIEQNGQPLYDVLKAFLDYIGARPVFFHNAAFDQRFIEAALKRTARANREPLTFTNTVYDSLTIAQYAWPALSSYKLSYLAKRIGAPAPTHRALADARATLAVLLAAKQTLFGDNAGKA